LFSKPAKFSLILLCLICTGPVLANNVTISDFFSKDGPEMAASPLSCDEVDNQVYFEAATVTVSSTGDYEIADAGNLLGFTGTGKGIVDIVISIFEDTFNPLDPAANRVATVDEGQSVALESGKTYLLVIQSYCEDASGVFAIVIRGTGTVSGAGFISDSFTSGQHSLTDDIADFPQGIGLHAYDVSSPVSVPQSGVYYFGDVGIYFNADLTVLVYENSFNPGDTSDNLVGVASFAGSFELKKDKNYIFVMVDQLDLNGAWQFALFPPGEMRFNETLKGSWVTPGVQGSGILMEIGSETGILFFAWFTFPEAPAVQLAKSATTTQADQGAVLNADIGSTDQRWLTGFGAIPPDSNVMNIKYENTTGGFFNAMLPVPTTDSNYGVGTVEVVDCENILVGFDLPGGVNGTAPMVRIIPDATDPCLRSIDAAAVMSIQ
jgi:hypothetical protein